MHCVEVILFGIIVYSSCDIRFTSDYYNLLLPIQRDSFYLFIQHFKEIDIIMDRDISIGDILI